MWFQESERAVSREEGLALAKDLGCLFLECSAKTRENVEQCFEELALKVLLRKFWLSQNWSSYATSSLQTCWYNFCCRIAKNLRSKAVVVGLGRWLRLSEHMWHFVLFSILTNWNSVTDNGSS